MNEYINLIGILLVLLIQAVLLYECLRSHNTVKEESFGLKNILTGLAEITEEAVDYLHDLSNGKNQPSPIIQGAGESIQQMILASLMNKISMPSEHGSTQEQTHGEVFEDNSQNESELES